MAELFRDYYQLLGVEPFADPEEVRRAWRRLAKQWHPDRNPDDPLSEQRFKQVQTAYRTLTEPELRMRYDELYVRRSRRARPTGQATGKAEDNAARPDPPKGGAAAGRARGASPTPEDPAPRPENRRPRTETPRPRQGEDLRQIVQLPLDRFEGGGRIGVSQAGQLHQDLNLPLSIAPGDELVLPGRGLPGRHGGTPGRLILELRPLLPEGVRLEGSDLVRELEVDALLLMAGGRQVLRHPAGRSLELTLPAGTQSGQRLRLRGQGLPALGGRGDLVLEIRVRIRPVTEFRARRLAEKLRRLMGDAEGE